jgi:hypothetical protein
MRVPKFMDPYQLLFCINLYSFYNRGVDYMVQNSPFSLNKNGKCAEMLKC